MSIPLSIGTLCCGGAIEALEHELQTVLDNIMDPNTDPKKVREVKLIVKIKPNEHRNMADVTVQASSKIIPAQPLTSALLIDKKDKHAIASEVFPGENPGQAALPIEGEGGKLHQIKSA